jgi:hypothetical protein
MSDQNEQEESRTQQIVGWLRYQGKPVMLQLREPYFGVTYQYVPDQAPGGGARAIPFLRGIFTVEPNGTGGMVFIVHMPIGDSKDVAVIALRPEDVLYCTHIERAEQDRIVAAA